MSAVEIAAGSRRGTLNGAIYVLAAGLCWSFTGIFLRLAPHFDPWQFLAWGSFGTACAIAMIARVGGHGPLARRLPAIKEEHSARGREDPSADRPIENMARDHDAGGQSATRMGELLFGRRRRQGVSGA